MRNTHIHDVMCHNNRNDPKHFTRILLGYHLIFCFLSFSNLVFLFSFQRKRICSFWFMQRISELWIVKAFLYFDGPSSHHRTVRINCSFAYLFVASSLFLFSITFCGLFDVFLEEKDRNKGQTNKIEQWLSSTNLVFLTVIFHKLLNKIDTDEVELKLIRARWQRQQIKTLRQ